MTKKTKGSLKRKRTTFEWAILTISIVAICSIGGGLLFYSFTFKLGPPDLHVAVLSDSNHEGRFIVSVENRGGTTAEDVVVEVTNNGQVQDVEFRAIPKGDREEALVEIVDPFKPHARIKSYKES